VAEHRKHHRVPVSFNVTCVRDDTTTFEGVVKDVSVGGMFIESEHIPVFGSPLTVVAVGLATRELRLPGLVRWAEPRGFGVQFGLLGAYATRAIVDLVKKQTS
jgi:PilZ domain